MTDTHTHSAKLKYTCNIFFDYIFTKIRQYTFSHSNSSKTTGQKNPLQVTSDLQRVFLHDHSVI